MGGSGELTLEAVSATGLKRLEIFTKQDPYVVFAFRKSEQRTATHQDASAEPRWAHENLDRKATFKVNPTKHQDEVVFIRVMNDNGSKKKHKLIGETQLSIADLLSLQEQAAPGPLQVQLRNSGKKAGTLSLSATFAPPTTRSSSDARAIKGSQAVAPQTADGTFVRIVALRAEQLRSVQIIFAQDPYLKVTARGGACTAPISARTRKASGKNPKWTQKHDRDMKLMLPGPPAEIVFEVFDAENILADRIIASAVLSLQELARQCQRVDKVNADGEICIALRDLKGKDAGSLFVHGELSSDLVSGGMPSNPQEQAKERDRSSSNDGPSDKDKAPRRDDGLAPDEQAEDSKEPEAATRERAVTAAAAPQSAARAAAETRQGKLTITILEGVALKKVQRIGEQDPYVVATLLPWELKSEKTKTMSGRNPKWSSGNVLVFDVPGKVAQGQIPALSLEVFDEELLLKHRFIGKGLIPLSAILSSEKEGDAQELDVQLQDTAFNDAGQLKVRIDFRGAAVKAVETAATRDAAPAAVKEGMLTVTALSASLTRSVEKLSKQDPFVEVSLLPWAGKMQQGKTKPVDNGGKQVVWSIEQHQADMSLYIPGAPEAGESLALQVSVKDAQVWPLQSRLIGKGKVNLGPHLAALMAADGEVATSPNLRVEVELQYEKKKNKLVPCGTCELELAFAPGPPRNSGRDKGKTADAVQPLGGPKRTKDIALENPHTIYVTVHKGVNLRNWARIGKQDPYVKLTLRPYGAEAKTRPVSDGGINVEWTPDLGNALQLNYPGRRPNELPELVLEVFDQEKPRDRLIGSRSLDPSAFLRSETDRLEHFEVDLRVPGKPATSAGVITIDIHAAERVERRQTRAGTLQVFLEEVTTTKKGDLFSSSDIYVQLSVTPGVPALEPVRSSVLRNAGLAATLNEELCLPVFDFGGNGVGPDHLLPRLRLEIMDRDVLSSDDCLGVGIMDLAETFAAAAADSGAAVRSDSHEITLRDRAGKRERGKVYAKLVFVPAQARGPALVDSMAAETGELRVWALEARGLKHVGGMLDRKQDPYLRVALQRPGDPDPGNPKHWPKSQRTATAVDAGTQCVWNSTIQVPHTEADRAFIASGRRPGFLHVAVFDEGVISDTFIGAHTLDVAEMASSLAPQCDDVWVPLLDAEGVKQTGEVRLAVAFAPKPPDTRLALRHEFAFVPAGTLHLLVVELDGLDKRAAAKVSGTLSLPTCAKGKSKSKTDIKLAAATRTADGKAVWNFVTEVEWEPGPLKPDTEPLMDVPAITIALSGSSGKTFAASRPLGRCSIPLHAFMTRDGASVEKLVSIVRAGDHQDTFRTLKLVGIFAPRDHRPSASVLAAMTMPAIENARSRRGSKLPPVRQALPGRLHVRVLRGRDLKNMDTFGKQDPYVQGLLEPGGTKFQTSACMDGGREPKWTSTLNNRHTVLVADADVAQVQIACFDEDDVGSDDLIGKVSIPLRPLAISARQARAQALDSAGTFAWWRTYMDVVDARVLVLADNLMGSAKFQKCAATASRAFFEAEAAPGRRDRLLRFYAQLADDGILAADGPQESGGGLEHKADKLHAKYPDTEESNKELFSKLYARFRPGETCPETYWKSSQGPGENQARPDLDEEVLTRAVQVISSALKGTFPHLFLDRTAVPEERKALVQSLLVASRKNDQNQLIRANFVDVAKAIAVYLINESAKDGGCDLDQVAKSDDVSSGDVASGGKTSDEDAVFHQTLWWALRDKAGKVAGYLELALGFTEDWKPAPRLAPPELLIPGQVHVHVDRAEFTTDKDLLGQQDPFVSIQWHAGDAGRAVKAVQTKVCKNSGKAATWNQLLTLPFAPELAFDAAQFGQTPALVVQARDKDPIGSDLIGETRIPILALAKHPDQVFTRALPLINVRKGETTRAGVLHVRMHFAPDTQPKESDAEDGAIDTAPPASGGRLQLRVCGARGLKDVQWFGKMDPIASLRLWPANQSTRTKKAQNAEQDPVWNETHTMDTEDALLSLLDVTVSAGSKTIGTLELPVCALLGGGLGTSSSDQWYPLVGSSSSRTVTRVGEIQLGVTLESDLDEVAGEADARAAAATAIKYIPGPGDLHIRIHRATRLRDASLVGKQDPYVELEGIDWRKPFMVKTNVEENAGADPVWDFSTSAVLEWGPADLKVPSLAFRIKDRGNIRDSEIFKGSFSLAPWLLGPGQLASMWIPAYGGGDRGGPYEAKPKHGALHMELQFIPHASFPGKPSSAFGRRLQKDILALSDGPRAGDVHVQVLAARNLVDVQTLGTQDPYVKLTLIAGGGKGDAALHFATAKTAAVNNGGSNPEWQEDLLLPYSEASLGIEGAGSTPLLLVEVWDANIKLMGDALIGRTVLPVFPFVLDQGQVADAWYPLTSAAGRKMGEIHLGLQFRRLGEAKRQLPSERPENMLNIVVLRGRNLFNAGDGPLGMGAQDPRVMFEFVGHDHVVRTAVAQDQGTEPVFEERLQLKGCMPNERGTRPRLRCTVVDEDVGADDFIGAFEFELTKQIMGDEEGVVDPKPLEQWFPLTDRAGEEPRGELHLILKRGPFPGDADEIGDSTARERATGKLYFHAKALRSLSDAEGRVPRRPFLRLTSSLNGKRLGVADGAATKRDETAEDDLFVFPDSEHIVIPVVGKSAEAAVTVGVYERKWSVRGKRATLIAEGVIPKLAKLTESFTAKPWPLSLKLKPSASSDGPVLGALEGSVSFLPRVAGQIRVHVDSVSGVKSQELMGGKNDLRVDLALCNGDAGLTPEHTTTKPKAGASASWNEDISLLYSNERETRLPTLVVRVVDVDTLTSNDLCGVVEIPLLEVFLEGLAGGVDAVVRRPVEAYALEKGAGQVSLGIAFFPDADIFERKRKQESKQMMALKRMWNILDANGDARLTKEELCKGLATVPECASFLGVDPAVFSADAIASGAADGAVGELFAEMNANDDDIVDFDEFRQFVESKPARDRQRKLEEEHRRQRARQAHEANLRRLRDLERERAQKAQEELGARRKAEAEARARELEEKRREQERARRLREEQLALEAQKRAQEELARLEAEADRLAKEERERKARDRKRAERVHHTRPQDVMLWRTRDVVEWLAEDLELPAYTGRFVEAAVDGPLLVALTEEDLAGAQLQIQDALHRRKILLRAARLYEMHRELVDGGGKRADSRPRSAASAASSPARRRSPAAAAENDLIRQKLARATRDEAALRAQTKRDAARRQQIWRFEYGEHDDAPQQRGADPFDWYEKMRVDIGSGDDSTDAAADDDEESFRLAMTEVRDRIVEKTGAELVDLEPPLQGTPQRAARLKNGEPVYSESPTARELRALPEEYWFQDRAPWYAQQDPRDARNVALKRIPEEATAAEVLDVLREAVQAFGFSLASSRAADTKLSLSSRPQDQEEQRLRDVYEAFCRLENNAATPTRRLSRLKFQGGVKALLGIELSWTQFDRVFRLVSPARGDGTNGTVQFDEFARAFGNAPERQRTLRRPKDAVRALRAALFDVCETLVKNEVTLDQLFRGFDRNSSGSISTAEFASMMRSLSNGELSKQQIYDLLTCMDADFDRRISLREFLDFWLVIFTQWLQTLKQAFLSAGATHSTKASNQRSHVRADDLEKLIKKVDRTMDLTFGRKARRVVPQLGLPGPLTSLLRVVGVDDGLVAASMGAGCFDPATSPRGPGLDAVRAARRRQKAQERRKYGSNEVDRAQALHAALGGSGPRRGSHRPQAPPSKNLNDQVSFVTDGYPVQ